MPDLFYLVGKWWKQLLFFWVSCVAVAIVTLLLLPKQYLSVATALPASAYATDKSSVFGNNVRELYRALGSPDDLDMIVGTARLDTVYAIVTDELQLSKKYEAATPDEARAKAIAALQKNSQVIKSDFGELKIKVWDKDRHQAALLANTLLQRLEDMHSELRGQSNEVTVQGLQTGKIKLQLQIDSISHFLQTADMTPEAAVHYTTRRTVLLDQLAQYEKLIAEYQVMIDTKPPVLVLAERAKAAGLPDKPRSLAIIAATAILSLVFGLMLILLLERRTKKRV